MQSLHHSLQTLVISHSDPHIDLDLSNMKELRILICDDPIDLISIPQNTRCLCYKESYFLKSNPLRRNFPKIPKKNQLAALRLLNFKPTYKFWKNFERLTKLETLNLEFSFRHEHILDISLGRRKCVSNFDNLYMLRRISLSHFNGKTISGFSSKHCNLRYLSLYACDSLQSCPSVGDLFALEELYIYNCRAFKELPNLQQLTRLRKLNIYSCNAIIALPGFGNLVALVEFKASICLGLVALPDMHKLTNLQTLDLGACFSLQGVPGLCELLSLQTLEVEHQALQDGFNLHKLNKLVTLHLRNWNGPPAFSDVVSLEHLRIERSGKGIERMPNLLNLARLQSVDIHDCTFKHVSCLGNLISLQSISILRCHSLETLPDMHKLTRLETLRVSVCPNLEVWVWVSISKSLGTLWVDQPRIGTVMALHTLILRDVGCRELPDLSLFPELKRLRIYHCPSLERLISTMPMAALECLVMIHCPELQEVPDLSHCKLLGLYKIHGCEKISLTSDEIMKLEALCPGLKIDVGP